MPHCFMEMEMINLQRAEKMMQEASMFCLNFTTATQSGTQ